VHTFKGHAASVAVTEEAAMAAQVDMTLFSPTVAMSQILPTHVALYFLPWG
jgi:hypothetical protein